MSSLEAVIIIPHYNDPDRLRLCLGALGPQVVDQLIEIVVVDNASTVDLSAVKADFPQVRFLDQPEKGAGPARNLGVSLTDAPRLFFTDSDCVPDKDWVATALSVGNEDKITGGPVNTFDATPPPKTGAQAFETVFAFPFEDYVKRQKFTGTGNLVTTRTVMEKTGKFAGGVFEDKDWCLRAGALGYQVHWEPGLIVSHPTRDDFAGLKRKWRSNTRVSYVRNGTRLRDRLRWSVRAIAVGGSGVIHLVKIARHAELTTQEKLRAGWTLLRLRMLRAFWMLGHALRKPDIQQEGRLYDDA